jgi:hypothetical protein
LRWWKRPYMVSKELFSGEEYRLPLSLRTSSQTGVAIRSPVLFLPTTDCLVTAIGETDSHTSDIGNVIKLSG